MGSVNLDNTGSGSAITLSSDGTSLLLDGTAIGGGGSALELYAENPSTPTAPSVTGSNAVAIGSGSVSSGDRSIAIGNLANATSLRAFAVGVNATASGSNAISMGGNSASSGSSSVAIGNQANSSSSYGLALGHNAKTATGADAVAIGQAYASGTDSFAAAISSNSSSYGATSSFSVAIGNLAKSTGNASIAIGGEAVATTSGSLAIGYQNEASSFHSVAIGRNAKSVIRGKHAYGTDQIYGKGEMQAGLFIMLSDTTDATSEALTTNNGSASSNNQVILPNNSAYSFSGTIIARQQAADGSNYASWEIKGALLRDANAASTVLGNGIVNKLFATAGASAWAIALTADTTNGGLKIEATGAAATDIRWVATVNTSEVTYA